MYKTKVQSVKLYNPQVINEIWYDFAIQKQKSDEN